MTGQKLKRPIYFFSALFSFVGGGLVQDKVKHRDKGDLCRRRRHWAIQRCSRYCKRTLKTLGAQIAVTSKPLDSDGVLSKSRARLYVSNHLSYLDVLVLASLRPSVFVTSVEVKHTFFLGAVANLGGSLFVERRDVKKIAEDVQQIEEILAQGFDVILFPEGTSTNGADVRVFKRGLFQAALRAGAEIIPVTINYNRINGQVVTSQNRDRLFWYDDMTFAPHLVGLMRYVDNFEVSVDFHEPLVISPDESYKLVSHRAWEKVRETFNPIL